MYVKTVSSTDILTLLFLSVDADDTICFNDIYEFFDIFFKTRSKNYNIYFELAMPMPNKKNYDKSLFIFDKNDCFKLVKRNDAKQILLNNYFEFVNSEKSIELAKDLKNTMYEFNKRYNERKIYKEAEAKRKRFQKIKKLLGCDR